MKTPRIISYIPCLLLLCAALPSQAQHLEWAYHIGSPQWADQASRIYTDDSAHVYVTGSFQDDVDFDLGPGEFWLSSENGSYSVFVMKMDSAGGFIWAKKIGGSYGAYASTLAFDHEGNLIIAGNFDDQIDADPGPGTFLLNEVPDQNNYSDNFILKLNSNGEFIWAKTYGSMISDMPVELAIDSDNNIYVAGDYRLTMDIDPGEGVYEVVADWDNKGYLLKLDSNGSFVWAKTIASDDNTHLYDLKIDASGNLYLVGYYSGTIDFDPDEGVYAATSAGPSSVFLLQLDPSGAFNWVREFGGAGSNSNGGKIIFDPDGSMYLTAALNGTIDVDPGADVYNISSPTTQAFIVKLDEQANFLWARSTLGSGFCNIHALALHPDGYLIAAGAFYQTNDLDMTEGVANFTSNGSSDYFMLHLNSEDGSHLWATSAGSYFIDAIGGLHIDADGNVYTIGIFQYTVDMDPGPGVYDLDSGMEFDVSITKLSACSSPFATEPMTGPAAACAGSTSAVFNCGPAAGASEIVWTVPEGSFILSGQNSTEMRLVMGNNSGPVVATIHYSCYPSITHSLEIVSQPLPVFTLQPTDVSITAGEDAVFTVSVSPAEASLQWYTQMGTYITDLSDGVAFSGTQSDTFTRHNVMTNQNNTHYFCIADLNGCADTTEVVTLTVLPTNISEIDDQAYLIAYPNPADNELYLQCSNLSSGTTWHIYDARGCAVASGKLTGNLTTIDLRDLLAGVYLVKCDNGSGESIRFVKH